MTILIQFGIFWGLNLFYSWLDITHTPAALYKYKIQPKVTTEHNAICYVCSYDDVNNS
jgi:hypothetical protein